MTSPGGCHVSLFWSDGRGGARHIPCVGSCTARPSTLPLLQHRLINDAMKEEMAHIHAFSIKVRGEGRNACRVLCAARGFHLPIYRRVISAHSRELGPRRSLRKRRERIPEAHRDSSSSERYQPLPQSTLALPSPAVPCPIPPLTRQLCSSHRRSRPSLSQIDRSLCYQ